MLWERKCGCTPRLACKAGVFLFHRATSRRGRDGRVGPCAGLATGSRRALVLAGSSHRKDALAAAGDADAALVAPSHDGGRGAASRPERSGRRAWPPGPSRADPPGSRGSVDATADGRVARLHAHVAAERAAGWGTAAGRGGALAHVRFVTRCLGRCVCACRAGLPAGAQGWVGGFCQPGRSRVPIPRPLPRPRPRVGALLLLRACRKHARLARPALILSQLAKPLPRACPAPLRARDSMLFPLHTCHHALVQCGGSGGAAHVTSSLPMLLPPLPCLSRTHPRARVLHRWSQARAAHALARTEPSGALDVQ